MAQLAIAWCAANPNVSTVILGATSVKQLQENLDSLKILAKLTPEVMAEIDEALGTKPERHSIHKQVYGIRGLPL